MGFHQFGKASLEQRKVSIEQQKYARQQLEDAFNAHNK